MWPDFSHIKDVPAIFLCFFCSHHLNVNRPGWEVSLLDGLEEVLQVMVWVDSPHLG